MAASASLRPLTAERVGALGSKVSASRNPSLPALWLPTAPEEHGKIVEAAVAFLIYVRPSGFMVALSADDPVRTAVGSLDSAGGEAAVVQEVDFSICTMRGRITGDQVGLLVDIPMSYVDQFLEAPSTRVPGVKDVHIFGFEADGTPGRPTAQSACQQADAWIGGNMDAVTAEEYLTGQEYEEELEAVPEPSEPVETSKLLARIAQLEAEVKRQQPSGNVAPAMMPLGPQTQYRTDQGPGNGTASGPRRAQSLFQKQMDAGGALTQTEWSKLHALAGPSPVKTAAAARQGTLQPAAALADNAFAELEKEVAEAEAADSLLAQLQNQPMDATQQILLAQLAQNSVLLRRLVGSKPADPLVGLLSGGSDSASGSSSGVRGCLARDAYVKTSMDLVAIGEVVRRNALAELGMTADREDGSVLRRYVERRIPLAEHRLLAHFATFLAEGWAWAYASGNAEMLGFVAKAMVFTEQVALDQGKLQLGWLLTGLPEPNSQLLFSHRHRPGLKPFSRLASPTWVSANLAYLKDLDFLEGRMTAIGKPKNPKPEPQGEDPSKKKPQKGKGKGKQQPPAQPAAASEAATP